MTQEEVQVIDAWFDAAQAKQPAGTLMAMVYIRDGKVFLGRGSVFLETKDFPLEDFPTALTLIDRAIEQAIEKAQNQGG